MSKGKYREGRGDAAHNRIELVGVCLTLHVVLLDTDDDDDEM